MDAQVRDYGCASFHSEEDSSIRKGPWTVEEDTLLTDYVTVHGEGRWNTAARYAGLKRTGKSCRLRWLNYLRPNLRRGNITLQEQLLILELHSRWGNRWSKIAQSLPGRTDNEIKNYWRTRVQKLAKQLKCDVNSKEFRDSMRHVWMPRLIERIRAADAGASTAQPTTVATAIHSDYERYYCLPSQASNANEPVSELIDPILVPEMSDESLDTQTSDPSDYQNNNRAGAGGYNSDDTQKGSSFDPISLGWYEMENLWNEENIWFLQQQLM
ncbi:hypothetical protein K2173_008832 [Erythroxylum novogranatense]|uniref:Uncharacterized protein n=1 Tax=Erythroxylum novogranatense TaxID=1862640 RepID=A0AAV8U988_9ROSI|nr:hypothetical protein K2173_008832 [Erythroxylum novogranatense]